MTLLQHRALSPWRDFERQFWQGLPEPSWSPAFDVGENDSEYLLHGDLPGMSQKDIEVRVEDSLVSIRGERAWPESDERIRRRGRAFGKFVRKFRLPESVDADGVKASYADGVLEISLPKRDPEHKSRRIQIN